MATEEGIQMLDQAGRVNGIIAPPDSLTGGSGRPIGLTLCGPERAYFFTTVSGKLYRRKTKAKGVLSCEPPIKPPGPRL